MQQTERKKKRKKGRKKERKKRKKETNKHIKCHQDSERSKGENYTNSDFDNLPSECITCTKFEFVAVAHLTDGQCVKEWTIQK